MEKTMQYAMTALLLALIVFSNSCSTCDSVSGTSVESGSGQYTALTQGTNCGPLLSEFDSFVKIQRPYYIRGHRVWTTTETITGGKVSLDKLTLSWEGNDHLLVGCRCRKEALDFAIGQWRDITVAYTFSP
jgi:hypothetical protein